MNATDKESHTTGQHWTLLRRTWKEYRIARLQGNVEAMRKAAIKIRAVQKEIGVGLASFPHLGVEFY